MIEPPKLYDPASEDFYPLANRLSQSWTGMDILGTQTPGLEPNMSSYRIPLFTVRLVKAADGSGSFSVEVYVPLTPGSPSKRSCVWDKGAHLKTNIFIGKTDDETWFPVPDTISFEEPYYVGVVLCPSAPGLWELKAWRAAQQNPTFFPLAYVDPAEQTLMQMHIGPIVHSFSEYPWGRKWPWGFGWDLSNTEQPKFQVFNATYKADRKVAYTAMDVDVEVPTALLQGDAVWGVYVDIDWATGWGAAELKTSSGLLWASIRGNPPNEPGQPDLERVLICEFENWQMTRDYIHGLPYPQIWVGG